MALWQNNQLFNNASSNNDNSLNRGAKIALLGSAIATLGDALSTIGGVIAIEEGRISDAQQQQQQQQQLDKLQSQIDELKKEQVQNSTKSSEVEMLGKLMEKLIERLEKNGD
jgi:TolA-binding protein